MNSNGRCRNYNHGHPNAPVHFCPAAETKSMLENDVRQSHTVWITVSNSLNRGAC
jgi:hypothetical protein